MRRGHSLLLATAMVSVAACGTLSTITGPGPAIVQMEVWNRTLDDVFLVDADGRLINVPACGHAPAAPLAVAHVELRMDAGRISAFGSQGAGNPQFLVVLAATGESFPTRERPQVLPICAGHPTPVPAG